MNYEEMTECLLQMKSDLFDELGQVMFTFMDVSDFLIRLSPGKMYDLVIECCIPGDREVKTSVLYGIESGISEKFNRRVGVVFRFLPADPLLVL